MLQGDIRLKINKKFSILLDKSIDETNDIIFRRSTSLSLTKDGFNILKAHIQYIYFPEKTDDLEMRYLLILSNLMFPYYIVKKGIYVFSINDGTTLTLYGNIRDWLNNYD